MLFITPCYIIKLPIVKEVPIMIDIELIKMKEAAQKKSNPLELNDAFLIESIFNNLSIETTAISREEVEQVVLNASEGVDTNKTLLIMNQKNAIMHVYDMVQKSIEMDENNLKDLHQILMNGFLGVGGLYRNVDISIKGSNHTPPSHIKVYDRMKKYFDFCLEDPKENLFEYIAYCHLQLAKIHPFLDGNGRCARLVLDYQLLRHGFVPVTFTADNLSTYFDCLEEFKVNKNIVPFVEFLIELEKKALEKIIAA